VRVEVKDRTAPWPPNPATQHLFGIWEGAAKTLKMRLAQEQRGGLSDGNFLWDRVPTLDGLGPAGNNAHCSERSPDGSKDQEYVLQGSFVPKALLNTLAMIRLAEGGATE
jgi:glutamate carboxypeptidase